MNLLQTKNYMIGFIAVLISIFSFNIKVEAREIELNYSDLNLSAGLKEEMNEIIDYLKTIENDNYVVLTYSYYYNNFRLDVVKKQDDLSLVHANLYIDDPGNPFMLQWRFNKHAYYIHFNFSDYNLNYLKGMIENNSYTLSNYNSGYYFNTRTNRNINQLDVLIYSNIEFTVDIENDYEDNFYLNGNKLNTDDIFEQYSNWSFVKLSSGFAQDLKNRDIYVITFLLSSYNANYKYQYSYDNQKFYDMTGLDSNNLAYWLNVGLNIPVYFRVLDDNDDVIWSTKYNENLGFTELDNSATIYEEAITDSNGKKVKIYFDLSDYLVYMDMYNYTIYLNDVEQNLVPRLEVDLNENTFDDTIYRFELKVDNATVEAFEYKPKTSDKTFEDYYEDVLEDNLEDDLGNSDYSDVGGMVDSLNSFINAIKTYISTFFDLIMGFFNKLNLWIRSFLIGIFIVMVICKIVKAVRK